MDPLVAILVVVVVILSSLLVVVGVQVIIILREFRVTLRHFNSTLDGADSAIKMISRPFGGLQDALAGLKSGFKVAESFSSWLRDQQDSHESTTT